MATKNIVPNADGEGKLGTSSKSWAEGHIDSITGTIATATQGSITSLGTLTTLTVDNVIVNGTTIGHTSDNDLLTLADQSLTVAGALTVSGSGNSAFNGPLFISHSSGDSLTLTKDTTEPSLRLEGDSNKDFVITVSGELLTFTQNDGTTDILTLDHDTKNATFSGILTSGGTITNELSSGDAIVYAKNGTVTTMMIANSTAEDIGIAGTESYHDYVIRTGNTEKMRISSGGVVTITQPANGFDVALNLTAKSAGGNTRTTSLVYDADTEKLIINNAGTEILRMGSSTGVIESNYGISFPNQSAGSGTVAASTLDAYEEGTWTPSVYYGSGSAVSISSYVAAYTRIGNLVRIQVSISYVSSSGSGSGAVTIEGFPYNVGAGSSFGDIQGTMRWAGINVGSGYQLLGVPVQGTNRFNIQIMDSAGGYSGAVTENSTSNGWYLYGFECTYMI